MTQPALLPLKAWQNVPYRERFSVEIEGVAVDLTGYDGRMQVRLAQGTPGDPLIDVSSSDDVTGEVTFPDAANGVVEVFIEQSALEALDLFDGLIGDNEPVELQYDIVLGGENAVYFYGPFLLYPGTTR